jgi:hypothetical protein
MYIWLSVRVLDLEILILERMVVYEAIYITFMPDIPAVLSLFVSCETL